MIYFVIVFIALAAVIGANIRIVPQARAVVIERLGKYHTTWNSGLHCKIPVIDRIAKSIDLREQIADFPPQPVITKDNVTMQIDTVVYYQVTDAKLFTYGISQPVDAIRNLTATTLRNMVGELELDATLTSRDTVNAKMKLVLDTATDPWGIKINRVELMDIMPPPAIRDAMEKQMKAEREKRESILKAEGEKQSAVLVAEGKKDAAILEAEARKQATILDAEAEQQARIAKATGEAEAIKRVKEAEAEGLKAINDAKPSEETLRIKALEALIQVGNGRATKLIVPSNLQDLTSLISAAQNSKS